MALAVHTRGGLAAARESVEGDSTVLAPLPRWFVHDVLLLLPADTRFWTRLDLTASGGVTRFRVALLRAAVAKARGQLQALDVSGRTLSIRRLCTVLAGNEDTLTELRVLQLTDTVRHGVFVPVLQRFKRLERLEVDATVCLDASGGLFLKKAPPYGALRVRRLAVRGGNMGPALFADLSQHTSLKVFCLHYGDLSTAAGMRAFVDAAIKLELEIVRLDRTLFTPLVLPELTRLVSAGAIRELRISSADDASLFEDAASTVDFCDAVRASMMTRLVLTRVGETSNVYVVGAVMAVRERTSIVNDKLCGFFSVF